MKYDDHSEADLSELEDLICDIIAASQGQRISADLIAAAILDPLDLPPELSDHYAKTHGIITAIAKRILKERFDPEYRYGVAAALAVINKDPDRLREIAEAARQEAKELDLFLRQKFGDDAVDGA